MKIFRTSLHLTEEISLQPKNKRLNWKIRLSLGGASGSKSPKDSTVYS